MGLFYQVQSSIGISGKIHLPSSRFHLMTIKIKAIYISCGHKEDFREQITFFDWDVYDRIRQQYHLADLHALFRLNV
jgi:hypothetical protein